LLNLRVEYSGTAVPQQFDSVT